MERTTARVPMTDLRREYAILKAEINEAIQRVIASGRFVLGEEVAAFEEAFADYCGTRYAVGVGSGTAAIQLALLACGIGPGDEVITVANTDIPTTMAISHCGAEIVWVDVDPRSFNIDPAAIETKITSRTKAILPVHLFGHPADMAPIVELARAHDLLVIEDGALAVGAEYRGSKVGGIGDVGCFSLAPGKILGAYGDAGIVTTDDRQIADRVRVLRNYGHDLSMDASGNSPLGTHVWKLAVEGMNERLDALQAAILRAKLPTLEARIDARRRVAARYTAALGTRDLVPPAEAPDTRHVYRAYTVLVDDRDRVRAHLTRAGIATQVYYAPPLHLQPAYAHLGLGPGSFPVTEAIGERMLCLPIFPEMTDEEVDLVVATLGEVVRPA